MIENPNNELRGDYDGTLTGEVEYGRSASGGHQIAIEVQLEHETVWSVLAFAGKAHSISLSKLRACGYAKPGEIGPQIKGNPVRVRVSYHDWENDEGDTKRIMDVNILDGAGRFKFRNEMSDSDKDTFLRSLAGNDSGYPPDWDEVPAQAGSFSLNKPKTGKAAA